MRTSPSRSRQVLRLHAFRVRVTHAHQVIQRARAAQSAASYLFSPKLLSCSPDQPISFDVSVCRKRENVHSNSPLMAFVRTGTLCALLNKALPNPPYCPLPQDKISTFLIAVPSIRSTVKNAKSPPAFKSMHRVRVLLGVPLHSTTSVGTVIVSSVTFPPKPICLYR